jgi:hypothetical protein
MGLRDKVRIDDPVAPGEGQRLRAARFWTALGGSPLHHWQEGMAVCSGAPRILVGLAPSYSDLDLDLADLLIARAPRHPEVHIDVFDVLEVRDADDLENYIPGIGKVHHTPIVGVWRNGNVVQTGAGFAGRKLILSVLGGEPEL